MTVDLSFCYVIIYESWSVDELDFRCKLVLIQCNNRSGAHSFQKSLQQIKKTQVLSFIYWNCKLLFTKTSDNAQ